jgi:hypothetical protein
MLEKRRLIWVIRNRAVVLIEACEANSHTYQVPINFIAIIRNGKWSAIRAAIVGYIEIYELNHKISVRI